MVNVDAECAELLQILGRVCRAAADSWQSVQSCCRVHSPTSLRTLYIRSLLHQHYQQCCNIQLIMWFTSRDTTLPKYTKCHSTFDTAGSAQHTHDCCAQCIRGIGPGTLTTTSICIRFCLSKSNTPAACVVCYHPPL